MKNLPLLAILFFSASIAHAQISHDCKSQKYLDKKAEKADVVLAIPLMGNVSVKKAEYKFQKATMAFQIENLELKQDTLNYNDVSADTMNAEVKTKAMLSTSSLSVTKEEQ